MTNVIDLETRRPVVISQLTNEEVQELHDEILEVASETFHGFCGVGILSSGEVTMASDINDLELLVELLNVAIETISNKEKHIT